jgi:hypothetical protein
MEKPKQKINARKFVEDFRSGMNEEELMERHGLTRVRLEKLYQILREKNLLDSMEIRLRAQSEPKEDPFRITQESRVATYVEQPPVGIWQSPGTSADNTCPQCGATVGKRDLTCPECGHMLSGEERWSEVEPRPKLLDRIPPKVLGCILAIPVAVILFFLFRNIIFPMSEKAFSKRADDLRKETQGKAPLKIAREVATAASGNIIQAETQRLMVEEILSSANHNFSEFTAGPRWNDISLDQKKNEMKKLREAMRKSGVTHSFRLVDESGKVLAKIGRVVQIVEESNQFQMPSEPSVHAEPPQAPAPETPTDTTAIERAVERQLPAGLNRKMPNAGF